jgi:hypothetical protein
MPTLELIEQVLRQLLDRRALDAGAQQKRQQFGICQGLRPACQQFFARAGVGREVS